MVLIVLEVRGRVEGQMDCCPLLYPLAENKLLILVLVVGAFDKHIRSVLHSLTPC